MKRDAMTKTIVQRKTWKHVTAADAVSPSLQAESGVS